MELLMLKFKYLINKDCNLFSDIACLLPVFLWPSEKETPWDCLNVTKYHFSGPGIEESQTFLSVH